MPERPIDPVTLDEAALILGCSRSTVGRLIEQGQLPPTERYRHRQLARSDVEVLALRKIAELLKVLSDQAEQ